MIMFFLFFNHTVSILDYLSLRIIFLSLDNSANYIPQTCTDIFVLPILKISLREKNGEKEN